MQSAGANPSGYVHPVATEVMSEIGIDLSSHHSKHLNEFLDQPVDTVITVCENAETCCPEFVGESQHYCWVFDDPAEAEGTEEEIRNDFRRIRDQICEKFGSYVESLGA